MTTLRSLIWILAAYIVATGQTMTPPASLVSDPGHVRTSNVPEDLAYLHFFLTLSPGKEDPARYATRRQAYVKQIGLNDVQTTALLAAVESFRQWEESFQSRSAVALQHVSLSAEERHARSAALRLERERDILAIRSSVLAALGPEGAIALQRFIDNKVKLGIRQTPRK